MADPVRVITVTTVRNQLGEPPGSTIEYQAHPDDLTRAILFVLATDAGRAAIRAGVDARLRDILAGLPSIGDGTGAPLTADDIGMSIHRVVTQAAPREPAHERAARRGGA